MPARTLSLSPTRPPHPLHALLLAGNTVQAARTFQLAMREPSMHEPEAFYGLAVARARGSSSVRGEIARLSSNIATSGEGIRMRIELGKLALGDHDYKTASQYLNKALRWQPNNIAAMVLLGEAHNLALKAGDDSGHLLFLEQPNMVQHTRMGNGAGNVVMRQARVKLHRVGKGVRFGRRAIGKPAAAGGDLAGFFLRH